MTFVGVDLAWAGRNHTGVAAVDGSGRLVHLGSARSDDEIVAALQPFLTADSIVAIDAPIIVRNPTGARPAERELNRDFAAFDAGAHASNTGKPEFAGESTRAAGLAARLGLTIPDPEQVTGAVGTGRRRWAVEVYPHPATIALFRLGRTVKYKQKHGRSVDQLRDELLRLIGLVEGLQDATPPLYVRDQESWRDLVGRVRDADRKYALRPAEDEVDAVICAYVALLAGRWPGALTAYGNGPDGFILTPTLPADHLPGKRVAWSAADPHAVTIRAAVEEYAARHPNLVGATEAFAALVTARLDDAGINYLSVTSRTKAVESFAGKAARTTGAGLLYPDPLQEITDQIGLRIITYLHDDVAAVADLLADQFVVLDDRDMGLETASQGRFGYASRHLLVATDPSRDEAQQALRGHRASIQIRTVLQHAWAEFEHDIRYKGSVPAEHAPDLDRRFTLAAGLLELADREFSAIRDRLQATMAGLATEPPGEPGTTPTRIGAAELAPFLAGRFSDAGWSRTDHYEWMSGLLLELGINSLTEVDALLSAVDTDAIDARMAYRHPAGAVRRLDDALLAHYRDAYLQLAGNAHREALLRARLDKLGPVPLQGGTGPAT